MYDDPSFSSHYGLMLEGSSRYKLGLNDEAYGVSTRSTRSSAVKASRASSLKLRGECIFYAGAVRDVLWVVGQQDIFRLDGNEWERIEHPDL